VFLNLAIIALQLFDAAIHVATAQAEPIRILSNLVMVTWVALSWKKSKSWGWLALLAYLGLNSWFLLQEGLTNPNQNNEPRILLLLLVAASSVLSVIKLRQRKPTTN
jgi:hypothetical protein